MNQYPLYGDAVLDGRPISPPRSDDSGSRSPSSRERCSYPSHWQQQQHQEVQLTSSSSHHRHADRHHRRHHKRRRHRSFSPISSSSVSSVSSFSSSSFSDNSNHGGGGSGKRRRRHRRRRQLSVPSSSHHSVREDWVCGICANLNSALRSECFRCQAKWEDAQRRRSAEIQCRGVPEALSLEEFAKEFWRQTVLASTSSPLTPCLGLAKAFITDVKRSSRVTPPAGGILGVPAGQKAPVLSTPPSSHMFGSSTDVYIRFNNREMAALLLQAVRCSVSLKDGICTSLRFGSGRHTSDSHAHRWRWLSQDSSTSVLPGPHAQSSTTQSPTAATTNASTPLPSLTPALPSALQQSPPASFASAAEEKTYLELMATHWAALGDDQKNFYNEKVKEALARTTAASSNTNSSSASTSSVPNPPSPTNTSTAPLKPQSLSAIKAALASRKAQAATVPPPAGTTLASSPPPSPASTVATAPSPSPTPVKVGHHASLEQVKAALAARRSTETATAAGSLAASSLPSFDSPTPQEAVVEAAVSESYFGFVLPPGVQMEKDCHGTFRVSVPIARRLLPQVSALL